MRHDSYPLQHRFTPRHITPKFATACVLVSFLTAAGIGCTEAGYNSASSRQRDDAARRSFESSDGAVASADRARSAAINGGGSGGGSSSGSARAASDRTGSGSGAMRPALAFPTGDQRTSAVLLEALVPEEVRVGQPYKYTLRVTNLTDSPLHNVRVQDVSRSGDSSMGMVMNDARDASGAARTAAAAQSGHGAGQGTSQSTGQPAGQSVTGQSGIGTEGRAPARSDTSRPDAAREAAAGAAAGARDTGAAAGAAAREAGRDAASAAREADGDALNAAREAGRDVRNVTREAGQDAGNAARDAGNAAGKATRDAGNAADNAARDAGAAARAAGRDAGSAARDAGNAAANAARDTGSAAREAVPASDTARDRAGAAVSGGAQSASASWNVGTLGPRETKTREFTATAEAVGSISNCLTVAYSPTLCVAVRVVKPDLQIVKSVAPEQALACQDITYTYRVTNAGTGTARDVRIEETLPEGLVTADGQRRSISIDVGSLAAGQSRDVPVKLRAGRVGEFAGRAVARAGDGLEAQSNDVSVKVREPVLAVDVTAPEARYVGEPVDFKITVKNTGDANADNVVVRLSGAGAAERMADRPLGAIEAGKSKDFTITTRGDRAATAVQLTATASATCAKQGSDSASVAFRTAPALQIECIDGTDPIRVGGTTTYTITVTNEGSGPDSNVMVRSTLPAELEFVAARDKSGGDVKVEGKNITFGPIRTLAPGASATWTIETKAVGAGDIRFGLELTSASLTNKPAMETEPTRILGEDNK